MTTARTTTEAAPGAPISNGVQPEQPPLSIAENAEHERRAVLGVELIGVLREIRGIRLIETPTEELEVPDELMAERQARKSGAQENEVGKRGSGGRDSRRTEAVASIRAAQSRLEGRSAPGQRKN